MRAVPASSAPASTPADGGSALTAAGGLAMVHGDEAIRQAIMLLLVSTVPGERLMRPDYGSHLHRLLFAPNDQTTAGLAIHYVRQALRALGAAGRGRSRSTPTPTRTIAVAAEHPAATTGSGQPDPGQLVSSVICSRSTTREGGPS